MTTRAIGLLAVASALVVAGCGSSTTTTTSTTTVQVNPPQYVAHRTYADFQRQLRTAPDQIDSVTLFTGGPGSDVLVVTQTNDGRYEIRYPASAESTIVATLDAKGIQSEIQR